MKIVVIGAGIAGLSCAITLRKAGHEVIIAERYQFFREVGLGFVIMPNGLAALDAIGVGSAVRDNGCMLQHAILQDVHGDTIKSDAIPNCLGIKRSRIIDALNALLPQDIFVTGFHFSHFNFNASGKAIEAVSEDGKTLGADLFVAADGANSFTRNLLFPEHKLRQTNIQELVGIATVPALMNQINANLLKTQNFEANLSFGILPCGKHQVIWYMQFNSEKYPLTDLTDIGKKQFTKKHLAAWPEMVQKVLAATEFSKVFLWVTRDMDVMPQWHRENVVLAGDAAHLALPFTSQGTNSALDDAFELGKLLANANADTDFNALFQQYHTQRAVAIERYLQFGRMLEQRFLYPEQFAQEEMPLPLAK